MFCVLSRGNRSKLRLKPALFVFAFLLTALVAVILSFCYSPEADSGTDYAFDLKETGGVAGFLAQFSLEYERQESLRELVLPRGDDAVFKEYGDFQSGIGLNLLKYSGKRVEERYLKLKNKTQHGKRLYAVVYIYKERVIAAHLTTLEQSEEIFSITAFA